MTVVLDRLERAGFVRRELNPDDRRSRIIRPVPAQMRRVLALYAPVITGMQQIFSSFSARDVGVISQFFRRANAAAASRAKE